MDARDINILEDKTHNDFSQDVLKNAIKEECTNTEGSENEPEILRKKSTEDRNELVGIGTTMPDVGNTQYNPKCLNVGVKVELIDSINFVSCSPIKQEIINEESTAEADFHFSTEDDNVTASSQGVTRNVQDPYCQSQSSNVLFYSPQGTSENARSTKTNNTYNKSDAKSKCQPSLNINKTLFVCSICERRFIRNVAFLSHLKKHKNEKSHQCVECNRTFSRKWNLTKHITVHARKLKEVPKKKGFECSTCKKIFPSRSHFEVHVRIHTGEKPYVCSVCTKGFANPGQLKRHFRVHSGERPYVCPICRKGFSQKFHLTSHSAKHTGQKAYLCPVCGHQFTLKAHLTRHQRVHTGIRAFKCDVCGKGFYDKDGLSKHKVLHSTERRYQCSMCDNRFLRMGDLKYHLTKHSGNLPFQCLTCGKKFYYKGDLVNHFRTHTGEKPYDCPVCGKFFTVKSSLTKHKKWHPECNIE